MTPGLDPADAAVVRRQLGRPPRGAIGVAHRCGCGLPDVVTTAPRLPDGTPFPTTFYLTCPRAAAAVSRLEANGLLASLTERLGTDPALAAAYAAAHEDYLRRRAALGEAPELASVSAGGMPNRVKCLHALLAHTLAAGPGVNPVGDEVAALVAGWDADGACVPSGAVAAVDCGTNSIRLLVVAPDGAGRPRDLCREMRIVRLGEGVDETGRLSPAALERTLAALADYRDMLDALGADQVRMVATSATRDAENRDVFVDGVRALLGITPEVVSGEDEARLSYRGATADLDEALAPSPRLVVDIGGGSTELVLGRGAEVLAAASVDVGCVRLSERHVRSDPPAPHAAALVADVDAAIGEGLATLRAAAPDVDLASVTLVGLAGSVTTVAALHLGLDAYDSERIHHSVVPAAAVEAVSEALLASTHAERTALGPMHPGRVDVIAAGALVLRRVVALTGVDRVVVSEHDILDGIAASLLP
jgi:exopolyphosphatase/guanosine-5'-triphosphate,3'-diphosphate pyrophosphatase